MTIFFRQKEKVEAAIGKKCVAENHEKLMNELKELREHIRELEIHVRTI